MNKDKKESKSILKRLCEKFDWMDFIIMCGYLIVIIFCIYMSIHSWNAGKAPEDYKPICIEGHTYHTINFGNKMAVAIKLDSEGKPIPCQP